MAQSRCTHKGDRAQIMAPLAGIVYADLRIRAAHHGTSISQLCADLLSVATGHPDLVREVHQPALLPPPIPAQPAQPHHGNDVRRTIFRVPRPVYAEIRQAAVYSSRDAGQTAADLLAIATGHREAVRQLSTERKVMPLAM
jgi:hypothetical protein